MKQIGKKMIKGEERYHKKCNFIVNNRLTMKLGSKALSALFKTQIIDSLYRSGQLTN